MPRIFIKWLRHDSFHARKPSRCKTSSSKGPTHLRPNTTVRRPANKSEPVCDQPFFIYPAMYELARAIARSVGRSGSQRLKPKPYFAWETSITFRINDVHRAPFLTQFNHGLRPASYS